MRCELIEQGDGSIATPKMNEVNVRTMEFCRRWGIAEQVLNCPFPVDYPFDVVFVTSLGGHEIGRMRRPSRARQQPEAYSPMRLQACSQMWFDPMLRALAQSAPSVRLRYRTKTRRLRGHRRWRHLRHRRSQNRRPRAGRGRLSGRLRWRDQRDRGALGIGLAGQGVLGHPLHLFFRAPDLLKQCGKEPGTFFLAIDRDGLWANIRVIDPANAMWRLMVLDSDGKQTPETIDKAALIRRAVGRPIDVEWLGVSIWTRRSVVADRYGQGRVFLAGDAVHQLSPTGALGMNTGIGDAIDLGWKLAAAVQGWGGANLLASYDTERRPIGLRNVGMTAEFYLAHEISTRAWPRSTTTPRPAARCVPVSAATWCATSARCSAPSACRSATATKARRSLSPTAHRRCRIIRRTSSRRRAPARVRRMWRSPMAAPCSIFTAAALLVRFGGAPEGASIAEAAAKRGVPLRTVTVEEPAAAALYERKLVLVRPDGHVAWRGDRVPADPLALVDRVRGA